MREALEQSLKTQGDAATASRRWAEQWRGRAESAAKIAAARLLQLLAKHGR